MPDKIRYQFTWVYIPIYVGTSLRSDQQLKKIPTKPRSEEKTTVQIISDFPATNNSIEEHKTNMKRVIATLASLAVLATVGHIGSGASAAAAVVGEPSKFSNRFLTSLEEVDADAAGVVVVETNNNVEGEEDVNALMEEGDENRRRLSWWSVVLMIGK